MSQADVQPTVPERVYSPARLFFSTTDRRGVIDMVNSTFVDLSRYEVPELLGKPHNIVRHPDMPAGVFHLVWEALLAGHTASAYIVNLAQDGAPYRTLAVVSPLGEGFLSVRSAVTREDLWGPVAQVYAATRAEERRLSAEGMPRAEVARAGAAFLLERVHELGFDSYAELMGEVLPAEMQERRRVAPPKAPLVARGERLYDLVKALLEIDAEIAQLVAQHDEAVEVAEVLGTAGDAIAVTLHDLYDGALQAATASEESDAKVLTTSARAALDLVTQVEAALAPLGDMLATERVALMELQAALAEVAMHADMSTAFAGEVATGAAVGNPVVGMELLGLAIGASVRRLATLQERAADGLGDVAHEISRAQVNLADFQRALTNWRTMVLRFGQSAAMGDALSVVDARLAAGLRDMGALTELAERCRSLAQAQDLNPLARAATDFVAASRAL